MYDLLTINIIILDQVTCLCMLFPTFLVQYECCPNGTHNHTLLQYMGWLWSKLCSLQFTMAVMCNIFWGTKQFSVGFGSSFMHRHHHGAFSKGQIWACAMGSRTVLRLKSSEIIWSCNERVDLGPIPRHDWTPWFVRMYSPSEFSRWSLQNEIHSDNLNDG